MASTNNTPKIRNLKTPCDWSKLRQILKCYLVYENGGNPLRNFKAKLNKLERKFKTGHPTVDYETDSDIFWTNISKFLKLKIIIYQKITTTKTGKVAAYGLRFNRQLDILIENSNNSLSLIRDLKGITTCFICPTCQKLFNRTCLFNNHCAANNCVFEPVYKPNVTYAGGSFLANFANKLFTKLQLLRIPVNNSQRFPEHVLCFDFECRRDFYNTNKNFGSSTVLTNSLVPISFALNTNVKGVNAIFYSSSDPVELVDKFWSLINEISVLSFKQLLPRYKPIIKFLNNEIKSRKHLDDEELDDDGDKLETNRGSPIYYLKYLRRVRHELIGFIRRLPTIG